MLSPTSVVVKHESNRKHKRILKKPGVEKPVAVKTNEVKSEDAGIKKQNSTETPQILINLKDFPKLRPSTESFSLKHGPDNNPTSKSWFSVVNNGGNKKNHYKISLEKDPFPELASGRIIKKVEDNSNKKKNEAVQNTEVSFKNSNTPGTSETSHLHKKSSSTKKTPVQPPRNPNKKKRADPIFFNLHEILETSKTLKKPKQSRLVKTKFHRHREREHLSGNFLDSSNPKRSRGKHREIKKKKLTTLKLSIIKERIIKQKIRESGVTAYFNNENVDIISKIDFKTEIEKYLIELNKRKIKKEEGTVNKKEKVKEKKLEIEQGKVEVVEKTDEDVKKNVSSSTENVTSEKTFKFSSKLREYCDNIITPDLNCAVTELIKELVNLQDKLFARDPIKAKVKRRHVSGIKEVKKHLSMKKVKLIVMAPNLEKMQMEGSVFDQIENLKTLAKAQNVPYVFALDRFKLGRCTKKNVFVSALAVLNYEGLETLFQNVLHHLQEAKTDFTERLKESTQKDEKPDVNSGVISSLISAFREQLEVSKDNLNSDSKEPSA